MNIDKITLNLNNRNIEIDGISLILNDDSFSKNVSCRLLLTKTMPNGKSRPIPLPLKPLTLWSGEEYDNIGDYTQAHAEQKVLELLAPNIQEKLQTMMHR
jgi:hypothetical protein